MSVLPDRVAEALSARARGGAAASVIAHHFSLAGQEAKAAEQFRLEQRVGRLQALAYAEIGRLLAELHFR